MKIELETSRSLVIVRLSGELDEHTAQQFRQAAEEQLDEAGQENLALDLSDVTFIDSSGLGAILGRYKRISQAGGRMTICGASPQVRRILDLSGLLKIIPFASDGARASS